MHGIMLIEYGEKNGRTEEIIGKLGILGGVMGE